MAKKEYKLKIKTVKDTLTETYGKFVLQPLERGYGVTVGNALRRVLLTSLPGAAITNVKVEGVLHEFSTISGVKEDMADIIQNLKSVRFKLSDSDVDNVKIFSEKEININGIWQRQQVSEAFNTKLKMKIIKDAKSLAF